MTRKLQILRGTTAQNNAYTGAVGELTMDTDRNKVRIHDGQTVGGIEIGNIPANYDYVVESQLPTADNGYTWYRKYKSGWVEQGGTASSEVTVTLPVVMVDNSYTLVFGNDMYNENVGTAIIVYGLKTASSFLAQGRWNGGGTGGIGFSWHVSGMSAQ